MPCKKRDIKIKNEPVENFDTYFGSIDELVGEGLRDGLGCPKGRLTRTLADQVNGLVDSAKGRNIDGLSADDTTRSDTGGVFTGAALADRSDDDLKGVLAGD